MVTVDDMKYELNWDLSDASKDAFIQKAIDRAQADIIDYTQNDTLDFANNMGLDNVVIYLAARQLNPDTKGRAGLASSSDGGGISYSFLTDLPLDLKMKLFKYRKVRGI